MPLKACPMVPICPLKIGPPVIGMLVSISNTPGGADGEGGGDEIPGPELVGAVPPPAHGQNSTQL
jgi:hypothetical protein